MLTNLKIENYIQMALPKADVKVLMKGSFLTAEVSFVASKDYIDNVKSIYGITGTLAKRGYIGIFVEVFDLGDKIDLEISFEGKSIEIKWEQMLFKAVIVVCSLLSPDECTTWTDQLGPYTTKEQCKERVMTMSRSVYTEMSNYKGKQWTPKSYTCRKLPGGML